MSDVTGPGPSDGRARPRRWQELGSGSAVAGHRANGFVGSQSLVDHLSSTGPDRRPGPGARSPDTVEARRQSRHPRSVDVERHRCPRPRPCTGCGVAYYLVHAMAGGDRLRRAGPGPGPILRRVRPPRPGWSRIVYLGGLGTASLSEHLASRQEVGRVLGSTGCRRGRAAGRGGARGPAASPSRWSATSPSALPMMVCPDVGQHPGAAHRPHRPARLPVRVDLPDGGGRGLRDRQPRRHHLPGDDGRLRPGPRLCGVASSSEGAGAQPVAVGPLGGPGHPGRPATVSHSLIESLANEVTVQNGRAAPTPPSPSRPLRLEEAIRPGARTTRPTRWPPATVRPRPSRSGRRRLHRPLVTPGCATRGRLGPTVSSPGSRPISTTAAAS